MKVAIVSFCLLAIACCGVNSQPITRASDVWNNLRDNIGDIFDRNKGKTSSTDINVLAEKLRLRIQDAINNVSEAKIDDVDQVIKDEIKDIDDSFGISEFFKKVGKAIDANIEFKNTGNNRFVYFL